MEKLKNVLRWEWECCVHSLKYEMSISQKLNGKGVEGARFSKLYKKTKFSVLILDTISLGRAPNCSHYCKTSVVLIRFMSIMERTVKRLVV